MKLERQKGREEWLAPREPWEAENRVGSWVGFIPKKPYVAVTVRLSTQTEQYLKAYADLHWDGTDRERTSTNTQAITGTSEGWYLASGLQQEWAKACGISTLTQFLLNSLSAVPPDNSACCGHWPLPRRRQQHAGSLIPRVPSKEAHVRWMRPQVSNLRSR